MKRLRHLVLVLGDQLDLEASAFNGFDAEQDAVWMAEAQEESTHVWSSKQRVALFLSAMRHFAQVLRAAGRTLYYHRLDDTGPVAVLESLGAKLQADLVTLAPERVVMTAPGDWRVFKQLKAVVETAGLIVRSNSSKSSGLKSRPGSCPYAPVAEEAAPWRHGVVSFQTAREQAVTQVNL